MSAHESVSNGNSSLKAKRQRFIDACIIIGLNNTEPNSEWDLDMAF